MNRLVALEQELHRARRARARAQAFAVGPAALVAQVAASERARAARVTRRGFRVPGRLPAWLFGLEPHAAASTVWSFADPPLPAAFVTAASTLRDKPEATGKSVATVAKDDAVATVHEKRQVGKDWWYDVSLEQSGKTVRGWISAKDVMEVAQPSSFKFETEGSSGWSSPFEDLRKAVAAGKYEPQIARLINGLNLAILPVLDLTLAEIAAQTYHLALVTAKGDFKVAALLVVAAIRAFKPSKGKGKYRWVQRQHDDQALVKWEVYADKLWHFFWNAYERFDGTGKAWLDKKGLAYELKSRPSPISSFFTLKDLDRDAKEDIAFNRGGSAFAEWIDKNSKAVLEHHYAELEKAARAAIEADPDASKLANNEKDKLVLQIMESEDVQIERKKLAYQDFAEYTAKHIDIVLDAIKGMK
jgi:hypothetical protein